MTGKIINLNHCNMMPEDPALPLSAEERHSQSTLSQIEEQLRLLQGNIENQQEIVTRQTVDLAKRAERIQVLSQKTTEQTNKITDLSKKTHIIRQDLTKKPTPATPPSIPSISPLQKLRLSPNIEEVRVEITEEKLPTLNNQTNRRKGFFSILADIFSAFFSLFRTNNS